MPALTERVQCTMVLHCAYGLHYGEGWHTRALQDNRELIFKAEACQRCQSCRFLDYAYNSYLKLQWYVME